MKKGPTLDELAHQIMLDKGFVPDFTADIKSQVKEITEPATPLSNHRDLRDLLWISIDNIDSRDLDQLTFAKDDVIFIAVADVDALVSKGSPIDLRAEHNTTSIYTPTHIFPMLPLELSNDLTSLNENEERCAMVVEMKIHSDGRFELKELYPAIVKNKAKLNYPTIGAFLEGELDETVLPRIEGLVDQIKLQDQLSQLIQTYRDKKGALLFAEIKLKPVIKDGEPVDLQEQKRNRADILIENYMIAANVGVTRFLKEKKLPTIRRIVKTPKRWSKIVQLAGDLGWELPSKPDPKPLRDFLIYQKETLPVTFPDLSLLLIKLLGRGEYVVGMPDGDELTHFNLVEGEYSHTTAPNRRFPDLIMQRILKSHLFGSEFPYSKDELFELAAHCTEKEGDASKAERHLIKCAAAILFQNRIGHTFQAIVTGSSQKGTWVRLQGTQPIEGKLTKGFKHVDVGDVIMVKLTRVDIYNGHIDFTRLKPKK